MDRWQYWKQQLKRLNARRVGVWALLLSLSACLVARPVPINLSNRDSLAATLSFDRAHQNRADHINIVTAMNRTGENVNSRKVKRNGAVTLGYSTGGLPIESYTFGAGPIRIVFVGGIHGGAEWNTILLAYTAIDYFTRHPDQIPPAVTLQIIPTANPDGQRIVTGRWGRFQTDDVDETAVGGRFNQSGVDLNRNWGCAWSATAWWGSTKTSGGSAPFSERETRVLRDFFLGEKLGLEAVQGVVFWHSAVPGVFAGGCEGLYPAAERLAMIYGRAAGYPYGSAFSYYPITGDATNWLSLRQIPAITVELVTHDDPEWLQNLAGMRAALDYLAGRDLVPIAGQEETVAPLRTFAP